MTTVAPTTVEEIQNLLADAGQIIPFGAATKQTQPQQVVQVAGMAPTQLDLRNLSGILEYEPGEYTFTAQAGTSLATVAAALAEHDQYMPFDPPLVQAGATLGGTVATGVSGSGRYRFGGVRDFLIGVRFVDGQGRLVRGGGKVVKNAAGFDLPKLMVGSLGQFGILTEVSFKVFPRPATYSTLQATYSELAAVLTALAKVKGAQFDIHALDLAVTSLAERAPVYTLYVRLGGMENVLHQRIDQMRSVVGAGEVLTGAEEAALWQDVKEFAWRPADSTLVKIATTVGKLAELEAAVAPHSSQRRYAVGGDLLWLAWPGSLATLDELLCQQKSSGLVIQGETDRPLLGLRSGGAFAQRIKQALDPEGRLPNYL
ncbi:MAG: FAD-binding protein [Caldilineaceae bacterium]